MVRKGLGVKGFTIVELLIVIVVIAVLATIITIGFRNVQQQARVATLNTDLSNAKKQLGLYFIDNGAYPTDTALLKASGSNTFQITTDNSVSPPAFCLTATSGTISYKVTNLTPPTEGACTGHSYGGVASITNLAHEPVPASAGSVPGAGKWGMVNRWAGQGSTASNLIVQSANDGPVSTITSYRRKTWTAVGTAQDVAWGLCNTGTSAVPVNPGDVLTVSVYLRLSRSAPAQSPQRLTVRFYDSGGTILANAVYGQNLPSGFNANQWHRLSATATVPAGAAYAWAFAEVYITGLQVGDSLDGTGIMVNSGSTLYQYADGNSANWSWNGTANASTSSGPGYQ